MKVIREGHRYLLENFEKGFEGEPYEGQTIQFIEKIPVEDSTEFKTIFNGTTNEEVLKVLINRLEFLDNKFSSHENKSALSHLNAALFQLEARTRNRQERGVEGKHIK